MTTNIAHAVALKVSDAIEEQLDIFIDNFLPGTLESQRPKIKEMMRACNAFSMTVTMETMALIINESTDPNRTSHSG